MGWAGRCRALHPESGSWHPNYIENDHQGDDWPTRLAAWQAILAILDSATAGSGQR